jgi:hypothetical protein
MRSRFSSDSSILSIQGPLYNRAAVKWVAKTELAGFEFSAADAQLLQKLNGKPIALFAINLLDARLKMT